LCTATFGIGTMEERPVVRDGNVTVAKTMTVTLNYNLKVMNQDSAARFAADVKRLMEGGLAQWIIDDPEAAVREEPRELVSV
ncbi:MAG: 2-oxo acid dehydrogenase subunit E2, partial [Candidatus Obscuribacterales bacterium]|nr:2-oxo acid dehydrogenase subunit E2 [Candidatus Obscuribacterales bacterium]